MTELPARSFRRTDKAKELTPEEHRARLMLRARELIEEASAIKPKPQLNRPDHYGCETFELWRPNGETVEIINQANIILDDIGEATVRQVYYQFVSRTWLDNNQREYNRLGKIISRARNAGFIRWNKIVDRTRRARGNIDYSAPEDLSSYASDLVEDIRTSADGIADKYRINRWHTQPNYIEVWVEKDALVGVVEDACRTRGGIPYLSCRGFPSDTVVYEAAKRMQDHIADNRNCVVLHLADHDPSGLRMTDDISERLRTYAQFEIKIQRIALNHEQTEGLPPNVVKDSDSRSALYQEDFGEDCWELDALHPRQIKELIRTEIEMLIDKDAWRATAVREQECQEKLREFEEKLRGKLAEAFPENEQYDLPKEEDEPC
jgi:hypothetical protein